MPADPYTAEQLLKELGLADNTVTVAQVQGAMDRLHIDVCVTDVFQVFRDWYAAWHDPDTPPSGAWTDLRTRTTAAGIGFTVDGVPWTP